MKKRLFKEKVKTMIKRSDYKDRPSYRRVINLVRKHLVRGWALPKMHEGKFINYIENNGV